MDEIMQYMYKRIGKAPTDVPDRAKMWVRRAWEKESRKNVRACC